MTLLIIFVASCVCLLLGYLFYSKVLERTFEVDFTKKTPAVVKENGADYVPTNKLILFGHHFSAIAGSGPIVGPITAALLFGWLPAVLWIVVACIFIGSMHDFAALLVSVRNGGESISAVCKKYLNPTSYKLYMWFCLLSLVYFVIELVDLCAETYVPNLTGLVGEARLDAIQLGNTVAYASFFYIILAIIFGFLLKKCKISNLILSCIFVPLVFLTILLSAKMPIMGIITMENGRLVASIALIIYALIASVLPVWLLLQPRDYLSSYLLFATIILSFIGIFFIAPTEGSHIQLPAYLGWYAKGQGGLFPIMFITIACGAVSGFHSLVAGGTTSKQIEKPQDIRIIGYGAMIVEGILAIISLVAVMIIIKQPTGLENPLNLFAEGFEKITSSMGMNGDYTRAFALLAISTFLLTSLDASARLGRYILNEFLNKDNLMWNILSTIIVLIVPFIVLFIKMPDPANPGQFLPIYKAIWPVFGASQQLLCGLCLLVIYIIRVSKNKSTWFVFWPMIIMIISSMCGIVQILINYLPVHNYPVIIFSVLLLIFGAYIAIDTIIMKFKKYN